MYFVMVYNNISQWIYKNQTKLLLKFKTVISNCIMTLLYLCLKHKYNSIILKLDFIYLIKTLISRGKIIK